MEKKRGAMDAMCTAHVDREFACKAARLARREAGGLA
jgi:hypothetical protein